MMDRERLDSGQSLHLTAHDAGDGQDAALLGRSYMFSNSSPEPASRERRLASLFLTWAVVLIVLLAFFLRTYQLLYVPPGFDYDEAAHAADALEIMQGHHALFSRKIQGVETFFMYLIAGCFSLLGTKVFVQRLLVAFMSTATVPATYLLARTMFRQLGKSRARIIGIMTALGLASSFWHMNYSRIGLEINAVPLFEVLCFLFFWRGLRNNHVRDLALSGFFLGLSAYVYLTPRFFPILLFLFSVYRWLTIAFDHRLFSRCRLWRAFGPLAIVGLVAVVTYAPMGIYFILNPADFGERAGDTIFLNPKIHQGDPVGVLLKSIAGNLGAFGFTSDPHWLTGLPDKPILNLALAALFWAGLVLALFRWREAPFAFCILWLGVMLVPVVITPDRIPHYARLMSLAPMVYMMPVLTLDWLYVNVQRLQAWMNVRQSSVGLALILPVLAVYGYTTLSTYHDYFFRWATAPETRLAFHTYAEEIAQLMNSDKDADSIYIIPCDVKAEFCDHYTIDFFRRSGAPHRYVRVDMSNVSEALTDSVGDKTRVHLVRFKRGKGKFLSFVADPKDVLGFLLQRYGDLAGTRASLDYDISTFLLPSARVSFDLPDISQDTPLYFGKDIVLSGADFGGTAALAEPDQRETYTGGQIWVVLWWSISHPLSEDYKVSLRLSDWDGHLVSQFDRLLMDSKGFLTSAWTDLTYPVGDYYVLSIPATAPPGRYLLELVVYSSVSSQPLRVNNRPTQLSAQLGTMRVLASTEVEGANEQRPEMCRKEIAPTLVLLLDCDLDMTESYAPGQHVLFDFLWEVQKQFDSRLKFHLELSDQHRTWPLFSPTDPVGLDYPTTEWRAGEVWRRIYEGIVPPDVPTGTYHIQGYLTNEAGQVVGNVVRIGTMSIAGRPRSFDVPRVQNTLEVNFEDKIKLLGYDFRSEMAEPGPTLDITLYWQALSPMEVSYTFFVHLLDSAGIVIAQLDSIPGAGSLPTTGWMSGEVITDNAKLTMGTDLVPAEYPVEVGWYNAVTGQRLWVVDDFGNRLGDHVFLKPIEIK